MQTEHDVADLGGTAETEPLPLSLIVLTTYVPRTDWRPERLSPGEAALALLGNRWTARSRPAEAMKNIRRAVEGAVALQGDRGEADEMVAEPVRGGTRRLGTPAGVGRSAPGRS